MPTSKKIFFHSPQLQTYLKESQAHGSIPPFAATATDATGKKKTEMQEYLLAWEQNWKGLGSTGYALIFYHASSWNLTGLLPLFIFGVPLTPQQEKLKFRMRGQVF
jgi:hypothetical protein